ncbi:MAG: putative DNA-binding domain-containing protein [Polyangiaceae bacterium]|nr:putative DNA-binding domain-containing protein [Polyangiaceae bacterium]
MSEREDFEDLLLVTHRLIRDADAPELLNENARAWLYAAGLSENHAEAFEGVGAKRILLYRKLVRNGMRSAIKNQIPRTAARLGAAFDTWVSRYCTEEMPRSHYLRDVAIEFVVWVLPKWENNESIPPYLVDLARYELFEFAISTAVSDVREPMKRDLVLDKSVAFDNSVRLQRYAYAVHRLSDDETDREEPAHVSTVLLGYRDDGYELQFLELSELAAGIVERLLAGKTLGESVMEAYGGSPPPEVLETIAQLLADLARRNVLLGAR